MTTIDFHTHVGRITSAFYPEAGQREVEGTPSDLLREMQDNGVDASVVFPQPMLPHCQERANRELFSAIEGMEELIPFAFVDPRLHETPELLERWIHHGVKGVKIHPIAHGYVASHSLCFPTYEVAAHCGLPLLIHSGWGEFGQIRFLADVAKQFPVLTVVIAHLIEPDVFQFVPRYDNLLVETSYASHPRRIRQAVGAFGSERVLFGSDHPYSSQALEMRKAELAGLRTGEQESVLGGNAHRLLCSSG